jgi:hypothetical protein
MFKILFLGEIELKNSTLFKDCSVTNLLYSLMQLIRDSLALQFFLFHHYDNSICF